MDLLLSKGNVPVTGSAASDIGIGHGQRRDTPPARSRRTFRYREDHRRGRRARRDPLRTRGCFPRRHGAAVEGRDDPGPRGGAGGAAARSSRTALRRTVVFRPGRNHPHSLRRRHASSLSLADPLGRRAHGRRRHRRLWPRTDGAGIRYRSVVHPALQANRLGRAGRRGYSVLPVGHGPEGRPRDALGR